jgi:DNA-binding transcriptional ArsR family regulator
MSGKKRKAALKSAAPVFAALGDQTRLSIVSRLCESGPMSITRLASGSRVTRQAITKHLHVLGEAGLVRGCRYGREQVWELTPEQLSIARQCLDLISRGWDDALDRLKAAVEGDL